MAGKTLTRADLSEAVRRASGLSLTESDHLVKSIVNGISDAVVQGEPVKLSGFGTFLVRHKGERMGRNPRTGTEAPITPRRVVVFRPSYVMRERINIRGGGEEQPYDSPAFQGRQTQPAVIELGRYEA